MEGFIPMVFRSLKKGKTRREYRPLSTPAAHDSYNIVDFYPDGYNLQHGTASTQQQGQNVDGFQAESKFSRRRQNKSFNHAGGRYSPEAASSVKSSKLLVRFRSQRRMFSVSCLTGA